MKKYILLLCFPAFLLAKIIHGSDPFYECEGVYFDPTKEILAFPISKSHLVRNSLWEPIHLHSSYVQQKEDCLSQLLKWEGTTLLLIDSCPSYLTHSLHFLEHLLGIWQFGGATNAQNVKHIVFCAHDFPKDIFDWKGVNQINEKLIQALFPNARVETLGEVRKATHKSIYCEHMLLSSRMLATCSSLPFNIEHFLNQPVEHVERDTPLHLLKIAYNTALRENPLYLKIKQKDFPAWMLSQIEIDLAPFKESKLSTHSMDVATSTYLHSACGLHNSLELARCRIHNGKVFIHGLEAAQQSENRLFWMLQAFNKLSTMACLPDTDFIICTGDAFGSAENSGFDAIPILTFAKHTQSKNSVLIPDFEALSDWIYEQTLRDTAQAHTAFPWEIKQERAFWRGGTTGNDASGYGLLNTRNYYEFPRIKLVQLSSHYPDLINAKLSATCQIEDPRVYELLAPYIGDYVNIVDHLRYKYQILVDGNTCAYSRAYWQLFSDSLIFKQASPNIQWYYAGLQPYVHYVPVTHDFSDLIEKIEWAKNHDTEAQKIVENAHAFAHANLKKDDIYLYLYLFLCKYAELFEK